MTNNIVIYCIDENNGCTADAATTYRSLIFAGEKVLEILKFAAEQTEDWKGVCKVIPCVPTPLTGCIDAPRTACSVVPTGVSAGLTIGLFVAELALSGLQQLYGELCTPNDAVFETSYQELRQNAIYNNVILNARNIITTFAATQQLKVMLGDVQAGLEDDREERDGTGRRLQEEDCEDISFGFLAAPCAKEACGKPTRLCDGSYNYPVISELVTG